VVVLRRTRPDLERAFRVPWVPVLPIASVLACVYLMLNLPVETWLRFLVWMVVGFVIYFWYGRRHSRVPDEAGDDQARAGTSQRSS
jgi:APA family basic amino acid/polyamine antiporter